MRQSLGLSFLLVARAPGDLRKQWRRLGREVGNIPMEEALSFPGGSSKGNQVRSQALLPGWEETCSVIRACCTPSAGPGFGTQRRAALVSVLPGLATEEEVAKHRAAGHPKSPSPKECTGAPSTRCFPPRASWRGLWVRGSASRFGSQVLPYSPSTPQKMAGTHH